MGMWDEKSTDWITATGLGPGDAPIVGLERGA